MIELPPLREVIVRHDLRAKKSLGQNFLLDEQLLDRIAAVPGDLHDAAVLEVGPGPGGLTRALLRAGAKVFAIEPDRRAIAALAELEPAFPGRLEVIEGDALKIDGGQAAGPGAHIVANLPYNIATPLLTGWLNADWPPWWKSLTLMFQREVAERICASPGGKTYGRLSVLAQWRSTPRLALSVNRAAFVPPPKVQSAVVHIVPGEAPDGVDVAGIERLTAAAFGQRRKMLRQSLKSLPGALDALDRLGIDATRRAETLSIPEFVGIARAIANGLTIGA